MKQFLPFSLQHGARNIHQALYSCSFSHSGEKMSSHLPRTLFVVGMNIHIINQLKLLGHWSQNLQR